MNDIYVYSYEPMKNRFCTTFIAHEIYDTCFQTTSNTTLQIYLTIQLSPPKFYKWTQGPINSSFHRKF